MVNLPKPVLIVIAVVFAVIVFGSRFYQSVPAGHVAVAGVEQDHAAVAP